MDDELKAIQNDLDSVLDRLSEYMTSDTLVTEGAEPQPSDREDAARVALRYTAGEDKTLEPSIHIARFVRAGISQSEGTVLGDCTTSDPESADFIEALSALDQWLANRWPLEEEHLDILALAVCAWSNRECRYIGEDFGLTLTPKRQVDYRKMARHSAAWDAFMFHSDDPQANPVDETLFERAGEPYGMSASTVSRAYYADDARALRKVFCSPLPQAKDDFSESGKV